MDAHGTVITTINALMVVDQEEALQGWAHPW